MSPPAEATASDELMQAQDVFAQLEHGVFLRDVTMHIQNVVASCDRIEQRGVNRPKGKLKIEIEVLYDRGNVDFTVKKLDSEMPKAKRGGTLLFAHRGKLTKSRIKQAEMFNHEDVRGALPPDGDINSVPGFEPAAPSVPVVSPPVASMPVAPAAPVASAPIASAPVGQPLPAPTPVQPSAQAAAVEPRPMKVMP